MEEIVKILNNNVKKLTLVKYRIPKEVVKNLFLKYTNINLADTHTIFKVELSLDFGFGSFALISNLSILIPEYLIVEKLTLNGIFTEQQLPVFVNSFGKILVLFPTQEDGIRFQRILEDFSN